MDAKTLSLATAFLCILSIQSFNTIKADEALINRLCDSTSIPPICTDCVKSDPSSANATDIGITKICLTYAVNHMDKLFQDTFQYQGSVSEQPRKDALGFCLDRFEDSKSKINEVWDKVQSRDFNGAKGLVKDQILSQVNSCPDHLKSKGFSTPWIVSDGIATVDIDWDMVLGILSAI